MGQSVNFKYLYHYTVQLTTVPQVVALRDGNRKYLLAQLEATAHGHIYFLDGLAPPPAGTPGIQLAGYAGVGRTTGTRYEMINENYNLTQQQIWGWMPVLGAPSLLHLTIGYDDADSVAPLPPSEVSSSSSSGSSSSSSPSSGSSSSSPISSSSSSSPSSSSNSSSSSTSLSSSSSSTAAQNSSSSPSSTSSRSSSSSSTSLSSSSSSTQSTSSASSSSSSDV